ncbi:VWA domain-containing protein [bacterium]|nr:VWA domain-containing protein [bacterium]
MSSKRSAILSFFLPALTILFIVSACDSPLDIDTPRNQYQDNIAILPGDSIGTAVSVDIPVDTTSGTWVPSHFSAVLVLDASGSISGAMNQYLRKASEALLDSLDGSVDEGAVVYFNNVTTVRQHITTDVDSLRAAVNALPMTGGTAMWDGMYYAMLELTARATHARRAIIMITDSDDNSSSLGTPANVLDYAERNGIMVFTITMRLKSHEHVLRNITDITGGRHYAQPLLSSLNGIYREIAAILRRP